jgi:hypothetical protein
MKKPRCTNQTLEDLAEHLGIQFTVFDDLADCVVGYGTICNEFRLVYSAQKIVRHFIRQGMSNDDAHEYAEFNVFDAYVGKDTPLILHKIPEWMLEQ